VLGKLVCSCAGVGEINIINKINEGCKDIVQLCQLSGAGMGCGSCRPEVKGILEMKSRRPVLQVEEKLRQVLTIAD
jgi:ferredoxin-nitrate reductase